MNALRDIWRDTILEECQRWGVVGLGGVLWLSEHKRTWIFEGSPGGIWEVGGGNWG